MTYEKSFRQLLVGDYKSAHLDLKKVAGYRIYSIYAGNTADRLIFTIKKTPGQEKQSLLTYLGFVANHDYQKCSFLNKKILKAYLEADNGTGLKKEFLSAEDFYPDDGLSLEDMRAAEPDHIHFDPVFFFNDQFNELNSSQRDTLSSSYPLVVEGSPGSGKTFSIVIKIAQEVEKYRALGERRILCVAQEEELVKEIKKNWQSQPTFCDLPSKTQVDIISYKTLFLEYGIDNAFKKSYAEAIPKKSLEACLVGKAYCISWLKSYVKQWEILSRVKKDKHAEVTSKKASKTPTLNKTTDSESIFTKEFVSNIPLMYQELRMIAAYTGSLKQYQNLGERRAHFTRPEETAFLYEALFSYREYLKEQGRYDPTLCPLLMRPEYDLVLVDETQDFSYLQIQELFKCAINFQVALFMDSHQSLFDSLSKRHFLTELLPEYARNCMNFIELASSYRCPDIVIELANRILMLKYLLTGGKSFKQESSSVKSAFEKLGSLQWIDFKGEESLACLFNKLKEDGEECEDEHALLSKKHINNVVVITQAGLKDLASKLFNTPLVFTPEEFKGLEHSIIIIFQLFDEEIFYQANEALLALNTGDTPRLFQEEKLERGIHRAKKNKRDQQFAPALNQAFTAMTRTSNKLIIVQEEKHKLRRMIELMKEILPKDPKLNKEAQPTIQIDDTNWEQSAGAYLARGDVETAQRIFKMSQKSVEDFQRFRQHFSSEEKELYAKAPADSDKAKKAKKSAKLKPEQSTTTSDKSISTTLPNSLECVIHPKENPKEIKEETYKKPQILSKNTIETNDIGKDYFKNILQCIKTKDRYKAKLLFEKLKKEKEFENILFEMKFGSETKSLFQTILTGKDTECISELMMQIDKVGKDPLDEIVANRLFRVTYKDDGTLIPPPIYWMMDTFAGMITARNLLNKYPQLYLKINLNVLNQTYPSHDKHSILFSLIECDDHQGLLQDILTKCPHIKTEMTVEILCSLSTQCVFMNKGIPLLNWLTSHPNRILLLHSIVNSNPTLLKNMPFNALLYKPPILIDSAKRHRLKDDPHLLLDKVMTEYSLLAEARPRSANNFSALNNLAKFPEGCGFLILLFQNNPAIINKITKIILFPSNMEGMSLENHLVFTLCQQNEFGINVLLELFNRNSKLLHSIEPSDFMFLLKCSRKHSLFTLFISEAGFKLLLLFFKNNVEIRALILKDFLEEMKKNPLATIQFLSLYGSVFLNELVKVNIDWFSCISTNLLMSENQIEENQLLQGYNLTISVFTLLTSDPEGWKFLHVLFREKPKLKEDIAERLISDLNHVNEGTVYENASLISKLLNHSYGQELFKEACDNNPKLAKKINTSPCITNIMLDKKASTLYRLSLNRKIGIPILEYLFEARPEILSKIRAESLFGLTEDNTSIFHNFTKTQKGCGLLISLFNSRPDLLLQVPVDIFSRCEKRQTIVNYSLLFSLCFTSYGRDFLRYLLKAIPKVIQSIPAALWIDTFVQDGKTYAPSSFINDQTNSDIFKQLLPSTAQTILYSRNNMIQNKSLNFFNPEEQKPTEATAVKKESMNIV
jgi:superfamily I DNA/RNA helicase